MAKGINFYTKSGYINIKKIWQLMKTCPWLFVTGGRDIGKTFTTAYSLVSGCPEEEDSDEWGIIDDIDFESKFLWDAKVFPFIWLRRTPAQYKSIANDDNHIFTKVFLKKGSKVVVKTKQLSTTYSAIYACDKNEETGEWEINPEKIICYVSSVQSLGKTNGLTLDAANLIVIDEFQRTPSEDKMSREFERFLNIVKSVARDRTNEGKPALRCLLLSNSNELANPYYEGLECIDDVIEMEKKHQTFKQIRKFGIVLLYDSPISAKEVETDPMYANLEGCNSSYAKMAINNEFKKNDCELIKSRSLKDCKRIATIDGITFYGYYENGEAWVYVSNKNNGGTNYGDSWAEHARFIKTNKWLFETYMHSFMRFENYTTFCKFLRIWDLNYWTDL